MRKSEQSFHDALAANNAAEHLRLLREEIKTESSRLTDLKSQIADSLAALDLREKEILKAENRFAVELEKNRIESKRLSDLRLSITADGKELIAKKLRLEKDISDREAALSSEKERVENEINNKLASFEAEQNTLAQLTAEKRVVLANIDTSIVERKDNLAELNKLENSKRAEIDTLSCNVASLQNEIAGNSRALAALRSEVEGEASKTRLAREAIEDREHRLERRERDYLILKGRLEKVLSKLYPGQDINKLVGN